MSAWAALIPTIIDALKTPVQASAPQIQYVVAPPTTQPKAEPFDWNKTAAIVGVVAGVFTAIFIIYRLISRK